MIPLKTSMVVTGQQNGGETRLDFLNGAPKISLETILDLSLAKSNGIMIGLARPVIGCRE
jgi:hypothetical protein